MAQAVRTKEDGDSRRLHIVQGEFHVTDDPTVVLSTLLGSCVSACIRDPVAGAGGMNHFLLPSVEGGRASEDLRYGVHAMELLINGILKLGGRRERLQVWLFGGARLFDNLGDVGAKNVLFAEDFVRREDLQRQGGSLGGLQARRIQFWPVSGRVRQLSLAPTASLLGAVAPAPVPAATLPSSELELF